MQWSIIPIKNLTSLFPLIFLSQHISLYALHRLQGILDIIWPLNQRFNLKNKRNWIKQVLMLKFWNGLICILLHRPKKLTLGRCGGRWLQFFVHKTTNTLKFLIRVLHFYCFLGFFTTYMALLGPTRLFIFGKSCHLHGFFT